jgi:hypothetical protein
VPNWCQLPAKKGRAKLVPKNLPILLKNGRPHLAANEGSLAENGTIIGSYQSVPIGAKLAPNCHQTQIPSDIGENI